MDMLVEQTHDLRYEWRNNERPLRFTDTRVDEQSRGISMKSTPMSLVLEASSGKSFVMNMVDTPGASSCHALLLSTHTAWLAVTAFKCVQDFVLSAVMMVTASKHAVFRFRSCSYDAGMLTWLSS